MRKIYLGLIPFFVILCELTLFLLMHIIKVDGPIQFLTHAISFIIELGGIIIYLIYLIKNRKSTKKKDYLLFVLYVIINAPLIVILFWITFLAGIFLGYI